MIFCCTISTPLGKIMTAAEDKKIIGLWFIGQKYYPSQTNTWTEKPDYPVFQKLRLWIKNYFAERNPEINFPLAPKGSVFQQSVWKILLKIPYGKTMSYGDVARKIAAKRGLSTMSAQAVGGAVGHNPVSLVIPCHRVVGTDGSLTGYAGGLDKKKYLLALERGKSTVDKNL